MVPKNVIRFEVGAFAFVAGAASGVVKYMDVFVDVIVQVVVVAYVCFMAVDIDMDCVIFPSVYYYIY